MSTDSRAVLRHMDDETRFLSDMCPYCGGCDAEVALVGEDRLTDAQGTYRVLRCNVCRGLYTSGSSFSDLEDYYRVAYPEEYHTTFSGGRDGAAGSNPHVSDALRRHLHAGPGPASILDVGCGNGGFLNRLRTLGFQVSGVEISPVAAEYGRTHYGLDIFTGRLEELDTSRRFDAITMLGTVEHLLNPTVTLSAAARLLKAEGVFVLDYPDCSTLEARLAASRWWGYDLPRHALHLQRREVDALLTAAGFVCIERYGVVRSWYHNSFLSPPQRRGVQRRSVFAIPIKAVAALFIMARSRPLQVCVCRLADSPVTSNGGSCA